MLSPSLRAALLLLVLTLAVVLPGAPALASPGGAAPEPTVDPALFRALQWRGIGPYRGGRALAVSGVPGDPYTFYAGFVAGGVWRSRDAGATWEPLTDHTPIVSVGALALAPSDPR
ncbi:MAG TPA: hypothetical protein VHE37_01045, partial [Nevskiaceae bacterium]|nr:hypothetical protein [Nevskiaceae bacterium]